LLGCRLGNERGDPNEVAFVIECGKMSPDLVTIEANLRDPLMRSKDSLAQREHEPKGHLFDENAHGE
jgi:hypothetical protein